MRHDRHGAGEGHEPASGPQARPVREVASRKGEPRHDEGDRETVHGVGGSAAQLRHHHCCGEEWEGLEAVEMSGVRPGDETGLARLPFPGARIVEAVVLAPAFAIPVVTRGSSPASNTHQKATDMRDGYFRKLTRESCPTFDVTE